MPSIRCLTPADFADICDMIDKHTSGAGAWCNDRSAPARPNFGQLSKDNIDQLFYEAMTFLFGYFDDDGKLVAWACLNRWLDNENITIRMVMEDPKANLPRLDGQNWSDAAVEIVNWGMGYFWSEGVSCFWSRVYAGREKMHIYQHPHCMLSEYQPEKVLDVPAETRPPDEYNRVSFSSIGDASSIYRFKDPLPLAAYLESPK